MADQTPPQKVIVSQIDAPFPEQWREGLFEFTKEIAAIKELLGVMAISNTTSAEAQKALTELYTKESIAQRASQAILEEQPQKRLLDQYGKPSFSSQAQTPAGRTPTPHEPFYSPEPPPGSPYYQPPENPSKPPDTRTPLEKSQDYLLENPVSMPQHYGGKYTTQDLLNLAAQFANWRNNQVNEGAEETGWGNATNRLAWWASKGAPNIEAGVNLVKTYANAGRQMSQGLQSYSTSLGYQPGEGGHLAILPQNNIDLGPLGTFRLPWNSGALSGAGSMINAFGTAMQTPGLSTQEAMAMQQALAEKGWFPGDKGTNEIFDAQTKLFSRGGVLQELATNPDVLELMDKNFRTGSASIKEITEMVEEIPEAAKTAHVGMGQMIEDMKTYGELAESQGGTRAGGAQQALELAAMTGQPAGASMGLMNNAWTQSMIFRQTGMPAWMQGALPGAIKNRYANQAFWQAARAVGRPEAKHYKDINGGTGTVTGISQQAAMMQKLPGFEEMSIEQIERRLRGGKDLVSGEQDRAQTLGALKNWKDQARRMMQTGHTGQALDRWISGGEEGQMPGGFGHLLSEMRDEMTADGRHRYSQGDIKKIREAGQGLHGDELIQEKYRAVKEIIETKAGKQSENQEGEQVTIGLSPAAKRFLTVEGRRARGKREANAGGPNPVNHSYTGATDPLTPNTNPAQQYLDEHPIFGG